MSRTSAHFANFSLMNESANDTYFVLVWLLRRQQWVFLCTCIVGALSYLHCVMRLFAMSGVKVLHPELYELLDHQSGDHQRNKKRYPGCLASNEIFNFYSVRANKRQPQYAHNLLQRWRRPTQTQGVTIILLPKHASVQQVHLLWYEAPCFRCCVSQ